MRDAPSACGGLSARIARHAAGVSYEALPGATVAAAKRAILDGLGVMLAASGESADILPFVEFARSYGGPPQASLLGFCERASLPMAALANGAMAHALDFEDAFDPVPLHPNASLLPAAFAIAEARGPVTGRDFIAAVAMGCDLTCRIGLSLDRELEAGGWYPPPILGAMGATAAAARLLRLTPGAISDALSLLLCQNSCPGEIKYSPHSVIRAVREAFTAQAAVSSVLLAERGVRGFDRPLEGAGGFFRLFADGCYTPARLLDRLGAHFWIEALSFKKWPCCRGTHAYIEAAQTLRALPGFHVEDIERVDIGGGPTQRMLCEPAAQKRAPQTVIDAKFSLPFTVAAAFLDDEIGLASFSPLTLGKKMLLRLAAKTRFVPWTRMPQQEAAAGELCVVMADGSMHRQHVERARGDPCRPLDDAALQAKFVDCAARAAVPLTRAAAIQLAERIWMLDAVPDVGAALNLQA